MNKVINGLFYCGLNKESYEKIKERIREDNRKKALCILNLSGFYLFSTSVFRI